MYPLISVIVPVYNVEKYLKQCLDSIINQTYKNLQIILIDDGSSDKSGIICDDYQQKDNRIEVIHKTNSGVAAARNQGVLMAKGDYIAFVDSDDFIEKDMYEILLATMDNDKIDMAVSTINRIERNGKNRVQSKLFEKDRILDKFEFMEIFIKNESDYLVNKLYKKNILKDVIFPDGKYFEDLVTMLQLITNSEKISYVNKPLYNYRKNAESITAVFLESPKKIFDRYSEAERGWRLLKDNYSKNISDNFIVWQCQSMLLIYEKIYDKQEYRDVKNFLLGKILNLEKIFMNSSFISNSKKLKCYTLLHCFWFYKVILKWEKFFKKRKL